MKRVLYVFVCSTVILLPFLFTVMHGSASADAERPPVSADRATPIPVTAGQKYTLVKQWGSEGNGEGQFMNPYGLALKPDGSAVYVADRDNHRIQKFDAQGNFLTQWGWYGPLPGQMRHPSAVVVDPAGGDVYVSDRDNFRIQRFTGDGEYLSEWGIEPPQVPNYDCQSCYSTFECTETLGPEWVCQDECCLNPYDPDAVEITGYTYPEKEDLEFGELLFPEQLTIAPDGLLYVSDRHRVQRVVVSFSEEIDDFVYAPVLIDERGVFAENEETGAFKGACNIANSDGESFWIIGKCGADEYHRIYKKSFRGCTVEKWASAKTPDDIDLSDWEESQGKVSNSFLAVDMLGD
ncbi:MAG: hypothetical protein GY850_31530, partial [bacterium]|nr:hypothetical protein [bacterium]